MKLRSHTLVAFLSLVLAYCALALSACSPITTVSPTSVAPSATPTTLAQASPTVTPALAPPTAASTVSAATPVPSSVPTQPAATSAPASTPTPRPPTATPVPPATNTPRPSPTPPVVVSQAFDGGGIPQACFQFWQTLPTTTALMFRVIAYDSNKQPPPCDMQKDGSGIGNVEFRFVRKNANGSEDEVYKKPSPEQNRPYCAFQDTNGVCNVWYLSEHNNRWPNGVPITNGNYILKVTVKGKNDTRDNELKFTIRLP